MNIKAKTCIYFTCFLCILNIIVALGDLNANGRIILKMNNRKVGVGVWVTLVCQDLSL